MYFRPRGLSRKSDASTKFLRAVPPRTRPLDRPAPLPAQRPAVARAPASSSQAASSQATPSSRPIAAVVHLKAALRPNTRRQPPRHANPNPLSLFWRFGVLEFWRFKSESRPRGNRAAHGLRCWVASAPV